jgi:hypothetical protein
VDSEIQSNTVEVGYNGTITHSQGDKDFSLKVFGNMNIAPTGKIDADGKGYLGGTNQGNGEGPGGGKGTNGNVYFVTGGGGYGGLGGEGSLGSAGKCYGNIKDPDEFGSGGGTANSHIKGGSGGGKIKLTVSGTLTNNGTISVNGANGQEGGGTSGGSGGSVKINAATFSGNGTIRASGGMGSTSSGGGSGGMIGIYTPDYLYSGILKAVGNCSSYGGARGGAGTVYIKSGSQQNGEVIIGNDDNQGNITEVSGNFDNVTITGKSVVETTGTINTGELGIKGYSIFCSSHQCETVILKVYDNGQLHVNNGYFNTQNLLEVS